MHLLWLCSRPSGISLAAASLNRYHLNPCDPNLPPCSQSTCNLCNARPASAVQAVSPSIQGFNQILSGVLDDLPEQSFHHR